MQSPVSHRAGEQWSRSVVGLFTYDRIYFNQSRLDRGAVMRSVRLAKMAESSMSTQKNESAEERKARRAKALRANLKRRKSQARDRSAGSKDTNIAESENGADENEQN